MRRSNLTILKLRVTQLNFVRGACAFGGLGHRGDGVRDHSRQNNNPSPRTWRAFHTEQGAPQIRHIRHITNWHAHAAQMMSWPARAARSVEQQGNDELARSGRALC